jgi:hypothetical protein
MADGLSQRAAGTMSAGPETGSLAGLLLSISVGALAFLLPWVSAQISYEPPHAAASTLQSVQVARSMAPPHRVLVIPAFAPGRGIPLPDPEVVGYCYDTTLW